MKKKYITNHTKENQRSKNAHKIKKRNFSSASKKTLGKQRRKKRELRLIGRELFFAFLFSIVAMVLFSLPFYSFTQVQGYGMVPTVRDQEFVLVQKHVSIQRFDLVAFKIGSKTQIRRVIGLSGEQVSFKDDTLMVDGLPIDEKFIVHEINKTQKNGGVYTEDFSTRTIPEDSYFVLGDNRPYATDSRHYGVVRKQNIIGVVKPTFF